MNRKILIIDDDNMLNHLVKMRLQSRNYEVAEALSGAEGLRRAYAFQPDLVILDVMMPDMDGFETCERLREISDVPILMLTACGQEEDVLRGFGLGVDDYMIKPFNLPELEARVGAILKRVTKDCFSDSIYNDGYLKIDLDNQDVVLVDERIHLSPTEFRLLKSLVERSGKVISHDELLTLVWGSPYKSATVLLSVYISYLRSKLEEDPENPRYIRTKWGSGYWFAPQKLHQI